MDDDRPPRIGDPRPVEQRESPEIPGETRLERRLDRAVDRAVTPRGAAIVIATATVAITLGSAVLMTLIDSEDYPSLGSALWWAVQTTTTVGYGDQVPTSAAGRFLAVLVMLFGIGFLTVITAAITSTFVARNAQRADRLGAEPPTAEQVSELDRRLERIEAALAGSTRGERTHSDADAPTADQLRRLDRRLERIEAAVTGRS
jgi:voltage-gated potassium channel